MLRILALITILIPLPVKPTSVSSGASFTPRVVCRKFRVKTMTKQEVKKIGKAARAIRKERESKFEGKEALMLRIREYKMKKLEDSVDRREEELKEAVADAKEWLGWKNLFPYRRKPVWGPHGELKYLENPKLKALELKRDEYVPPVGGTEVKNVTLLDHASSWLHYRLRQPNGRTKVWRNFLTPKEKVKLTADASKKVILIAAMALFTFMGSGATLMVLRFHRSATTACKPLIASA